MSKRLAKKCPALAAGLLSLLSSCSQPVVEPSPARRPARPRAEATAPGQGALQKDNPPPAASADPPDDPPKKAPQPAGERAGASPTRSAPKENQGERGVERPKPRLERSSQNEDVRRYVLRLKSRPEEAEEAFRELWSAPKELIPALILEIENTEPSQLKELKVLVLDTKGFCRLDEKEEKFVYRVKGMGKFSYDDLAAGQLKSGRGIQVKVRNFNRFPVGVVIRAALVNRFRSTDYPPEDDARDPVHWWQSFYERAQPTL